jgi:Spy/CpxP family protein refolding chaperone
MKKRLFTLISTALIFFVATAQSSAIMMGEKKADKGMGMMDEMMTEMHDKETPENLLKMIGMLDLSDNQKNGIQSIRFAWMKDKIRKSAEIDIASVELKEILAVDPVDIKQAEQKVRERSTLSGDLEVTALLTREKIKALLTQEQITLLKKHMESRDKMKHGIKANQGPTEEGDEESGADKSYTEKQPEKKSHSH